MKEMQNSRKLNFRFFIAKFERLKDENITTYFLQFDELVKNIKGLGDKIKEEVIVKKALRYLPMRFD
jgi:type II restriction/modification system DNA methylase subunit YeeA